jgi:hypothetical protein
VAKLRAGEIFPEGMLTPPAERMDALLKFVQSEFERADKNAKIDTGRVTAHRLNRAEYSNTIRDLLGVDFRASEEFPDDDSGYGFDIIGDVLTVSPARMQKYLSVGNGSRREPCAAIRSPRPASSAIKSASGTLPAVASKSYCGLRCRLHRPREPGRSPRGGLEARDAGHFGGRQTLQFLDLHAVDLNSL